jgi:hypothetical protein
VSEGADVAALGVHLAEAAEEAGYSLDPLLLEQCKTHFGLLVRWNRTHNLTRIVAPKAAATGHYLDCLLGLSVCPAEARAGEGADGAFMDVGSGAGFPGLLAAAAWKRTGILVEPSRKRQSFLKVAAKAMGLEVSVAMPQIPPPASTVMTRATFSEGLRQELWGYVRPGGVLLAWTTPHELFTWKSEASTWSPTLFTTHPYTVDGVSRVIVAIHRGPMPSLEATSG